MQRIVCAFPRCIMIVVCVMPRWFKVDQRIPRTFKFPVYSRCTFFPFPPFILPLCSVQTSRNFSLLQRDSSECYPSRSSVICLLTFSFHRSIRISSAICNGSAFDAFGNVPRKEKARCTNDFARRFGNASHRIVSSNVRGHSRVSIVAAKHTKR